MASNKSKNTYDTRDFVRNINQRQKPKDKIGYFQWIIKSGGWKKLAMGLGGAAVVVYMFLERKAGQRRFVEMEAELIIEQGIQPTKQVNKDIIKSDENIQFGQSHVKENKVERDDL